MSQAFFALEITQDAVRACCFSREGRRGPCLRQKILRLPGGADFFSEEEAVAALKALGAEKGPVHVCLPAWDFMIRNMDLPFRGAGRIGQILPMEMGAGLGMAPESCEITFLETEKKASGTGILAFALENRRTEALVRVLGEAGYFVEAFSVSQIAAASGLSLMEAEAGFWAFVDTRGVFVLMSGARPLCVRVFPGAGRGEGGFIASLSAVVGEVCGLRYPEKSPAVLRVTGPDAASLAAALEKGLGLSAEAVDLKGPEGPDPEGAAEGDPEGACAVLACWAAIRGLASPRFRETGWRMDHFMAAHGRAFMGSLVLTLSVLVLLATHVGMDMRRMHRQDRLLDLEIQKVFTATLPGVTRIVDPLHQMRTHLDELEQATAFAASASGDRRMVDILRALVESTPEGASMQFSRLAVTGDQLTLSGETDTYNHVDSLKNRLATQPFFSGVTITQASADQEGGRVRFNLRSDLR